MNKILFFSLNLLIIPGLISMESRKRALEESTDTEQLHNERIIRSEDTTENTQEEDLELIGRQMLERPINDEHARLSSSSHAVPTMSAPLENPFDQIAYVTSLNNSCMERFATIETKLNSITDQIKNHEKELALIKKAIDMATNTQTIKAPVQTNAQEVSFFPQFSEQLSVELRAAEPAYAQLLFAINNNKSEQVDTALNKLKQNLREKALQYGLFTTISNKNSSTDILETFIARGARINKVYFFPQLALSGSALILAIAMKNVEAVRMLLAQGATVNLKIKGVTPISLVTEKIRQAAHQNEDTNVKKLEEIHTLLKDSGSF